MDLNLKQLYVYGGTVDFRKGIDGLSQLVASFEDIRLERGTGVVFVSKGRNKIKLLYPERHGFCLWQKRLHKRRVSLGEHEHEGVHALSPVQLEWLRSGLDLGVFDEEKALNLQVLY